MKAHIYGKLTREDGTEASIVNVWGMPTNECILMEDENSDLWVKLPGKKEVLALTPLSDLMKAE